MQRLRDAGITDKMLAEAHMMMPKQDPSERELRPEDVGRVQFPSEFMCKLCDAKCTSAVSFQSHLAGTKHKNNVAAAAKGNLKPKKKKNRPSIISLNRKCKIEELFSEVKDSAVIGLDYITEFQKLDPKATTVCVCNLCESKCDENTVVSHVAGLKHKIRYMREKHPVIYEHFKKFGGKKSKQAAFAEELARDVEKEDGRGMVNLKVDLEDGEDDDAPPSIPSLLDMELESYQAGETGLLSTPHTSEGFHARPEAPKTRGPARSEADEMAPEQMRHRLKHQMNITARRYGSNVVGHDEETSPGGKRSRAQNLMLEMSGVEDPYAEEQPKGYQWNKGAVDQGYHGRDYHTEVYEGQEYQEEYQAEQCHAPEYQGEEYPNQKYYDKGDEEEQYPREEYQEQGYSEGRYQNENYQGPFGKPHLAKDRFVDPSVEHEPYSQGYGPGRPHDDNRGRGRGRGRNQPRYEDDPYKRPKPSFNDDPYQRSRQGYDEWSRAGNYDESEFYEKTGYGDHSHQHSKRPPTRPPGLKADSDDADMNKRRLDDLVRRGLITETERKNMELAQNVAEEEPKTVTRRGLITETERKNMELAQNVAEEEPKTVTSKPEPSSSFDDLSFLKNDPDFKEFLKARVQSLQQQQQQQQLQQQQQQQQEQQAHEARPPQREQTLSADRTQRKSRKPEEGGRMKREKVTPPPVEEKNTAEAKGDEAVAGQIGDMLQTLSSSMISSEDEAAVALQVSNALTQALLSYRLRSHPGETEQQELAGQLPPKLPNMATPMPTGFPQPGYPGNPQPIPGPANIPTAVPPPVSSLSSRGVPAAAPPTSYPTPDSSIYPKISKSTSYNPYMPPQNASLSSRGVPAEASPTSYPTQDSSFYPPISKSTSYNPYTPPQTASNLQYPPGTEAAYSYHGQASKLPGQYQYPLPGGSYSHFQPPLPNYEPPKPPPPPPPSF